MKKFILLLLPFLFATATSSASEEISRDVRKELDNNLLHKDLKDATKWLDDNKNLHDGIVLRYVVVTRTDADNADRNSRTEIYKTLTIEALISLPDFRLTVLFYYNVKDGKIEEWPKSK